MKAHATIPTTVDEYLQGIGNDDMRSLMQRVREIIIAAAPRAIEGISYRMPAYKQEGVLIYFAAFTHHCSLFPASTSVLDQFSNELAAYKTSKGTIQFTVDHPLPDALVTKIVKARVKENEAKARLKKSARSKRR